MRSLRTKVATTVALFAIVLGLAASAAAAVALWQKDRSDTSDAAASLVFDVIDFNPANVERLPVSGREIAMVLDDEGNYKHADTDVSDDVIHAAFDSAVLDAIDTEFVSFDSATVGSTQWSFAGLACPDEKVCSSVVTGVSSPSLQRYLLDRWYFLMGVALASAMCAYVCARWLVGRSLRPVEAMRKELASITTSRLDRRVVVPQTRDEVQHVGSTLNDTLDRLERAVRSNERFVADAAHELRSPLTGVRLALEMEVAKGSQPLLADALIEVDRATRLVDDLLVLAKRPSNPRRVDVDLDDLLNDEVNTFRLRFPDVRIEMSASPARLKGDPDALRRVTRNLLDNAAFYGRGRISVATAFDADTNAVMLRVDDDGPGIAPTDRERVFDRFTRLDSSRSRTTGGSGLGLAIVKEIVDDHLGQILVSDAPLGGTRMTLTFDGPAKPA